MTCSARRTPRPEPIGPHGLSPEAYLIAQGKEAGAREERERIAAGLLHYSMVHWNKHAVDALRTAAARIREGLL